VPFLLNSPAFDDGDEIPSHYTCDGANVSPPLEWSNAPPCTRSFLVVMEDLDTPRHPTRHWGLYDIIPERTVLPEAVGHGVKTEPMGRGVNDFGHPRYDGPAPPNSDPPHHYQFRIAALDVEALVPIAKEPVADLWELAQPHILATATLTGTYAGRRRPAAAPTTSAD